MVLVSWVRVDAEPREAKQSAVTDKPVTRAKRATAQYNLSAIRVACLGFEVAQQKLENKPTVDVLETMIRSAAAIRRYRHGSLVSPSTNEPARSGAMRSR